LRAYLDGGGAMMGFTIASLIALFIQVLLLGLIVLAAYALILVIKALQIYIRKNN
jgi:hypothetical protein